MSAQLFETILAKLYTDGVFRKDFLDNPHLVLSAISDLTQQEKDQLLELDKIGLVMASHSFEAKRLKRESQRKSRLKKTPIRKVFGWLIGI